LYINIPLPIINGNGPKFYFQLFLGKIKIKSCFKSKYKLGKLYIYEQDGVIYGSEKLLNVDFEKLSNNNNYHPQNINVKTNKVSSYMGNIFNRTLCLYHKIDFTKLKE
jgi:hypothetical protein